MLLTRFPQANMFDMHSAPSLEGIADLSTSITPMRYTQYDSTTTQYGILWSKTPSSQTDWIDALNDLFENKVIDPLHQVRILHRADFHLLSDLEAFRVHIIAQM